MVELTASDASQGGDVKLRLLSVEDAENLMTLFRETWWHRKRTPSPTAPPESPGSTPPAAGPEVAPFSSAPVHSTEIADLIKFTLATSGGAIVAIVLLITLVVGFLAFPEVVQDLSIGSAFIALGRSPPSSCRR